MMKKKHFKILKSTMVSTFIIIGFALIAVFLFMQQAKFGKNPSGTRLERIKQSPNFKNGKFQNKAILPKEMVINICA